MSFESLMMIMKFIYQLKDRGSQRSRPALNARTRVMITRKLAKTIKLTSKKDIKKLLRKASFMMLCLFISLS